MRESIPNSAAPTRLAKKAAPKRIEVPPTNTADPQLVNREEAKPAPADKTDSSALPNPTPGSEAGSTRE